MDPVLRELTDQNEIRELVIKFSTAMDDRDAESFRSAWADVIELDIPTLGGDAFPLSGRLRADDYTKNVMALLGEFKITQHFSTNHLISIKGNTGHCRCYTLAQHYLPMNSGESWLLAGARYNLVAARLDRAGWRFTGFALTSVWSRGNAALWTEAAERAVRSHRAR